MNSNFKDFFKNSLLVFISLYPDNLDKAIDVAIDDTLYVQQLNNFCSNNQLSNKITNKLNNLLNDSLFE